jgi:hypothetical protein
MKRVLVEEGRPRPSQPERDARAYIEPESLNVQH